MIGVESGSRGRRRPSRRLLFGIGAAVVLAVILAAWRMAGAPAAADTKDKDAAVPPLVTVVIPALGNVA